MGTIRPQERARLRCRLQYLCGGDSLFKNSDPLNVPRTRTQDYGWLLRNLGVTNKEHPDFQEAMSIAKQLRKEELT